jgi:uncharacterized protein YdhG (YjbR/CyaY superfamily)
MEAVDRTDVRGDLASRAGGRPGDQEEVELELKRLCDRCGGGARLASHARSNARMMGVAPAERRIEPATMTRRREMSSREIDEYVGALEEPKRGTLHTLRRTILEVLPEADQVISYGVPAFRVRGQTVAGFAAFKTHLSYLPFSGSVLGQLGDELEGYKMTKSSLHFPVDRPLPKTLVQKLIDVRLTEIARRSRV